MNSIPYEIILQIIQCFGKCIHYKDNLESFLVSAGINRNLARKYRDDPKYAWGRKLLDELSDTEDGRILQKRLLVEFYKLKKLPDNDVPDRDAGITALRKLKEMINESEIEVKQNKKETISRKQVAINKIKIVEDRKTKLEEIRLMFVNRISCEDRQKTGFDLEDIIKDLFRLSEIQYKKSYRTDTQQIDGYFRYEGFDYIVEAKWRSDHPTENEIGGFQRKVKTKLESTRGIFVSVNGFREEVIKQFNGLGANIIFFTGEDLIFLLEGRVDLKEALNIKIEKAAQYGIVYCRLVEL